METFSTPAPCSVIEFKDKPQPQEFIRILRLPEVMARVGLKRASIYNYIAQGSFPKQIALSDRAVGWIEEEINAWLATRISASRRN